MTSALFFLTQLTILVFFGEVCSLVWLLIVSTVGFCCTFKLLCRFHSSLKVHHNPTVYVILCNLLLLTHLSPTFTSDQWSFMCFANIFLVRLHFIYAKTWSPYNSCLCFIRCLRSLFLDTSCFMQKNINWCPHSEKMSFWMQEHSWLVCWLIVHLKSSHLDQHHH